MNNSKAMPPRPHDQYNEERRVSWDLVAKRLGSLGTVRHYYHSRLQEVYRLNIPKGSKVLELGCGCGDLLASVNPSVGVGVDFSGEMLEIARSRYPDLSFHQQDVQQLVLDEKFDLSPILTIVFASIGVSAGMYNFIKSVINSGK